MKKEGNGIIVHFTIIVICTVVALILAYRLGQKDSDGETFLKHEVFVDTITFYKPVARDSVVVKYITERLPVIGDSASLTRKPDNVAISLNSESQTCTDSVQVIVPITQVIYEDSTYKAYVSGFRPTLDSIYLFPKHEVVTIKKPPNRWHVGPTIGYGFTPHGCQPYIGVSITFSIISF